MPMVHSEFAFDANTAVWSPVVWLTCCEVKIAQTVCSWEKGKEREVKGKLEVKADILACH